ncbi:hypothetical protein FQZ97_726840 [compost metagenome]
MQIALLTVQTEHQVAVEHFFAEQRRLELLRLPTLQELEHGLQTGVAFLGQHL